MLDKFGDNPSHITESAEGAPEEEAQAPVDYEAAPGGNLAPLLPHAFLTKLASRAIDAAELAYKSTQGWRERKALQHKLYNGDLPDVGADQPNITPVHLPFAKRAVRIFISKLVPALYPQDGYLLNLKVRSEDLKEWAELCSLHMNFQLYNQIPEYLPSHDRGHKQNAIEGSIVETWWYDPVEQRPCQEISLAEDFWFPYTVKSDRPDMADIPHKTWRKRFQQHQLEDQEVAGYYVGVTADVVHPDSGTTKAIFPSEQAYDDAGTPTSGPMKETGTLADRPVKEVGDANSGQEEPSAEDPDAPRVIYEQDRWVKLPGQDRARLVTICIDKETQQILRLALCEIEDPKDRARFDSEMAAWEQQSALDQQMFSEQTAAYAEASALAGSLDPFTGQPFPAPSMLPPEPPPQRPQPSPPRKIPWHRHSKCDFDTNPNGSLGHGVLDDVEGHNLLANKVATRHVSQMTLNMLPTGIASRNSKFTRGETKLRLGEINESALSPEQVQAGAGLYMFQFPPADPNAYKLLELADKSAQEVTAYDIAAGAAGLSGETATESEMRNSNATANISLVGQRVNRWRAQSLRNLAIINSQTLPTEAEGGVTVYRDGRPVIVTREMYQAIIGELEVTFTCDPNFESKPLREKRAMKTLSMIDQILAPSPALGIPVVDPQTYVQMKRQAAAAALKALDVPREWIAMVESSPMPAPPGPPPGAEGAGPDGAGAEAGGAPGGGPGMDGGGPPTPQAGDGGPGGPEAEGMAGGP